MIQGPRCRTGSVTTIVVAVPAARLGTAMSCSRSVCPAFVNRRVFVCPAGTTRNGSQPSARRRAYGSWLTARTAGWLTTSSRPFWLAGVIVKGYGFGLLGNMIVGVVGSFVGEWLFGRLGFSGGLVGELVAATVGSVILLFVLRFIRRTA